MSVRRRVCAVLVAVLASGASTAAAGVPRWHVTRLPLSGRGPFSYAEPGVATGPGRSIVADAASANTGDPPTFWLSRDDGASWSAGRDLDLSGQSTGDTDAAFGADGWLYVLNLGYSGSSNPAVEVYRSRDARRWAGPAAFPPPHGTDQPDRPWLVVDPRHPADVDVVNSEAAGNFVLWRSTDHAASFTGPYDVGGGAPNLEPALALSSRPLLDPTREGRMFMFYVTATPAGVLGLGSTSGPLYEFPMTQLWLASSLDGGLHWTQRLVLDTGSAATIGHLLPASAIDRAGRLVVAVSARPSGGTRTQIWILRSADHGVSWSPPAPVPAPTPSNVMPALAVTPSGATAYLSWYASSDADYRASAARWVEMAAMLAGLWGRHTAVAVAPVDGSRVVHVGGIDTAGAVGSDLGADWSLRDFQSIALDACNRPHAVWASDAVGAPATLTAYLGSRCPPSRAHHRRRHQRRRHHHRL